MTEAPRPQNFLNEPPMGVVEACRYGLAMIAVAAAFSFLALTIGRSQPNPDVSEAVDSAVLIDLPPTKASSSTPSDAEEGQEQQATQASIAQPAPSPVDPPKTIEAPESDTPPKSKDEPPLAVKPDPAAILQRQEAKVVPPPPITAPDIPAQAEHAPQGSTTPTRDEADLGDEGEARPSAHAITLWQKALMKRLEVAKRFVGRDARIGGTVRVAFEIDGSGALLAARVVSGSGSAALDSAALALVRRAAPFPEPPRHAQAQDMSFVVPIRFRK